MKKKLTATLLTLALTLSLAACGGGSAETPAPSKAPETQAPETQAPADDEIPAPSSPLRYSLGGGSSGGNFYLVGGGLATVLNNALPDYFVFTGEETGGSTANLTMLQNGEIELGISMTSSLTEAWEGTAEWTGGPMTKLRGLVPLYPSNLTIYTKADSGINSLQDINGKIIGLGSKGAAMDSVWRDALPALGVEPASIFNDGHAATATALSNGVVDVALLFSLPPFSAIAELEASEKLNFIGLTPEEQEYLTDTYSFYSADVLPAGSYEGVTEDLDVVSEWNMLVATSDLSEDYGYLLTKTLFENNPALVEIYKGLTYVTPENALNFNIPLQAGTVRYLKEVGIDVPDRLIPAEYAG